MHIVFPKEWEVLATIPNSHWYQRRDHSTWTVSHISAETFFQNKCEWIYKLEMNSNCVSIAFREN